MRIAAALAGASALAIALAACAPGSGGAKPASTAGGEISTDVAAAGDITLTVWDQEVRGGQDEQMKRLNEEFQKKYPNVTINRVSQAFDDLNKTLRLALTGEDAPDVVQSNNGRNVMGAFVKAGQLRPLDDYAGLYGWKDRFAPSVLQYSSYSEDAKTFGSGSVYGLPQTGEVVGVFYSKKALATAGITLPSTWKDFESALATAKSAGAAPLVLGNIDKWPAIHVFGPVQGSAVPADTIAKLGMGNAGADWTSAESVKAAETLQGWATKGYFNDGPNGTDYDAAWQSFGSGQGMFLIGGSWLGADLQDAMGDDVGFFVPSREDGTSATTGGTGLPFAITSAARNTDVAAAYIDFITSDEAMKILAETGNMPVNGTAALAPARGVQADIFSAFGMVTGEGDLLPYLDYATPTFSDTLGDALQGLIDGKLTPQQFTEALQADYSGFVSSNG
ncbi:raffinose/stachyose/melibiose transport system substrate-binding protein [Microbacterium resistens]|uniref:Raffinose/stachyose/melibiose transport system substrate-binding protein n=1 Tax=Microbacterium resistens TaxID=156977 RepID=A0ABU1SBE9_9MICO|nr:extracellular solute-binding protein [Microbacterium resistens]MDR6866910.1 raffinose/stachyose/melibiose transport system substrate-binding protein [Microbacterium resistens]